MCKIIRDIWYKETEKDDKINYKKNIHRRVPSWNVSQRRKYVYNTHAHTRI